MSLRFRFAVISDPHIALPHTIWDHPSRFHLVEISIPALEIVLQQLAQIDLDFLLLPGDLTQHGEPENHRWLADRLAQLPYPAYVIPGNHDIPALAATQQAIGLADFPTYYSKFGYACPTQSYYACDILPGVQLIGLNSIDFDRDGKQLNTGHLAAKQMAWLRQTLAAAPEKITLVMIHHNVIEHLPGQAQNPLGRRYMLDNAAELLSVLSEAGVKLLFTGHLHIQDIAHTQEIYEITTGSLVSFPHPYRVLEFHQDKHGGQSLRIASGRVKAVPGWADLQADSREWMGERSFPFMLHLLTQPPLNLSEEEAKPLTPVLRYFWADIANGDAQFSFPQLPPAVNRYFMGFGAIDLHGNPQPIDNATTLML